MAIDQPRFTDAIKPQDGVAVLITLLGIAIAIFLPESIIKLIGASIAALAALALYITLKQRANDRIQLRRIRTTLPPPDFKTRVTTDPTTSTTRIRFDDSQFQETFAGADDDFDPVTDPGEGFRIASKRESGPPSYSSNASLSYTDSSHADLDDDFATDFAPAAGESFRVITPQKGVDTVEPRTNAEPRTTSERRDGVQQQSPTERQRSAERQDAPATASGDTVAPAPPLSAPSQASAATEERRQRSIDATPVATAQQQTIPVPETIVPSGVVGFDVPPERIEPVSDGSPTRRQTSLNIEELIEADAADLGPGNEPRGEFVRLVGQVLNAIARSIQGRSIIFFWINFEKGHLIPEAHVTTGRDPIRGGARIPLGNDIVSQIARSGAPEIITDISPAAERELICYYNGAANTRSFVGVPVYYRREVVGVLAADSNEESGFDEVSVATLAEYTRLIAGLIRSYTEKYDLHLIARTLDAFESMSNIFSGSAPSPKQIAEALVGNIAQLFDNRYVAILLFDEPRNEWNVAASRSETHSEELGRLQVDMRGSLVGRATQFAKEVLVEGSLHDARFSRGENLPPEGTFLAVPLIATTKCFGALTLEHPTPHAYIPRDVELIRDLTRYAAMAIEVFNTNRAIDANTMLDESTGLYNTEFLLDVLDREILRARDFKDKLSFGLISIDMPSSLRAEESSEIDEMIAASVGAMIQNSIRPYDTVGRYHNGTFGAVLVSRNDQDAYLWAEKLRKEVASRILALGQRKSAVTISVGICDLGDLAGRAQMVDGAQQALAKARGGEGNAVILY
jgi:diguanylate cyclase (GGDEF)-like protein